MYSAAVLGDSADVSARAIHILSVHSNCRSNCSYICFNTAVKSFTVFFGKCLALFYTGGAPAWDWPRAGWRFD